MKKLLVMLLLFFPVHGAWAENIYLSCISKEKIKQVGNEQFYYLIYPEEKKIYASNLPIISGHEHTWATMQEVFINFARFNFKINWEGIEIIDKHGDYSYAHSEIDRVSGKMQMTKYKFGVGGVIASRKEEIFECRKATPLKEDVQKF